MEALLVADYIRGVDSTGLARISVAGNVAIAKELGNPFNLIASTKYDSVNRGSGAAALIGHNRYATTGAQTAANAHPFQFEHIVGAHNGTLTVESFLALEGLAGQSFPVDSMAIFAAIAKVGIEEVAKELEGAFALVWADLKKGTLNFWRNDERTLWYCFSKTKKLLGWASKFPFLSYAFQSFDVDFEEDEKGFCFIPFEVDTLYSWSLTELAAANKTEAPKPEMVPLKAKGGTPVWLQYSGAGYACGWWDNYKSDPNLPSVVKDKGTNKKRKEVLYGTKSDPYAGIVLRPEFEELTANGCSFCSSKVEWGDRGLVIDTVNHKVLCKDCSPNLDTTVRVSEKEFGILSSKLDQEYLDDELPPFTGGVKTQ